MSQAASVHEVFSDARVTAYLTCHGNSCVLDVRFSADQETPASKPPTLEVLLQPRDARDLPHGAAVVLHREQLAIDWSSDKRSGEARSWLPGITTEIATRCHFRIRGGSMDQ